MKQRIFSHFQDYLIQYISHQYQNLLHCTSSQYILSTYNSQHNNNSNVVLAIVVRVEDIVHDPKGSALCLQPGPLYGIVIVNTTLLYKCCIHVYIFISLIYCIDVLFFFNIYKLLTWLSYAMNGVGAHATYIEIYNT